MWKKAVPTIALCSFLLVGCNNDEAVPSNNETPMGELNNGNRVITPSPGGDTGNGVGGNGGGAGTGTTDGMNGGMGGEDSGNRGINHGDDNGTMGGNNGNGNSTLDRDKGTWVEEPTVDGNGR